MFPHRFLNRIAIMAISREMSVLATLRKAALNINTKLTTLIRGRLK